MALKSFLKTIYPIVRFFSKKSIFLLLGSCFLVFGIFFYFYIFKDLPSPRTLSTQSLALTTYIRDRNGKELYKIYRTQNRTLIPLSQIPLQMRQAILSIEDKNFYQHRGFSITGTIRALYNSRGGRLLPNNWSKPLFFPPNVHCAVNFANLPSRWS
jgi:membrane carboxypeptidase/penicillin-binding protein